MVSFGVLDSCKDSKIIGNLSVSSSTETETEIGGSRFLVLLATFNGGKYVRQQVESIAEQRDVYVELSISDDGSTDNTVSELLDELKRWNGLSVTVAIRKLGSASGNFFRLLLDADVHNFDFIALSDQDDIWDSHKLSRAASEISKSNAAGYSAAVTAQWDDGSSTFLSQCSQITEADYLFEGAGQGCTFVLRADLVEKLQSLLRNRISELPKIHYHDWLIYATCRSLGLRWSFDSYSCMAYRQHSSNDTGARSNIAGIAKRLRAIRSGWYAEQVVAIADHCAYIAGKDSVAANLISKIIAAHSSFWSRLSLMVFVFKSSRRRLADRLVLCLSVLFGYI